jgi:oxygen-dependent protoporphyrinogen oxidase
VVVGAGAAGLAAAWTLVQAGVRVEVLERRERPGGRLRTERFADALVEVGAQFLASHQVETRRIAREIGAADLIVPAPGRDALWRRGRAHPIQYGSVTSMLTSGALPTGLKLRMASRYVPFLHRHGGALNPNDARPAAAAGLDGESIADWGREHLGDDFVELLARPQTAAYYGSEPETTSAALYHSLASAALDLRLSWVRGGMGELARRWADAIVERGGALRCGAEVAAVRARGDRYVVEPGGADAGYAAAVVATPAPVAARLLDGEPIAALLSAVEAAPSALAAVALGGPWRPGWFGLGLPRSEPGGSVLAVVASAAGRVRESSPAHDRVALLFPAPEATRAASSNAPAAAFEAWWPAAREKVGGAAPERARVYRETWGHSLFPPGFGARLAALRDAQGPGALRLAGDYLVSPSVEGAVRSGIEAAQGVLRALAGR